MSNPDLNSQEKHQAYKTGYRFGLKGRSLSHIPSQIRGNTQLRSLYDQGWQEAQQEMMAGDKYDKKNYIRHRVIWIVMTALAGIITAYLIIQNSQVDLPDAPSKQAAPVVKTSTLIPINTPADWESVDSSSLSLLSDQERLSLSEVNQAHPVIPKQAVKPLNQEFKVSLYNGDNAEQKFTAGAHLPKYVRQLILEVDTHDFNKPMALTIRWLWQRHLIQTQNWPAERSIIQSKQSLFSAQQGAWAIEILDPSGQLIYLYEFSYVQ
ncbi:MAG: hypothetical protein IBX48_02520 [Thiomicrospira sp.]|uniref:hypothetical protein n=1 Tax=Thiomicrospira sp. TaxID=935 RepID=UPI0019E04AF2|nr:hypothetical protein [Thiomicrospira sp.]MBE0493192.1 hypothetical protein [Thiomicrospira sp.]